MHAVINAYAIHVRNKISDETSFGMSDQNHTHDIINI